MSLTGNGIFVVRGELATLMTAMRRGARWNSNSYHDEQQDGLMKPLYELKTILHQTEDLRLIEPNKYLSPFLNIIKSEETTGVVTSLALSAVNKFLSYGLIDPTHATIANTVENIAYAANHARFVGTDPASDAVVLMKIVQVLRTLMLSPEGSSLSNDMICEVMLSCFKICFESRLNEILRRSAEQALRDMVLLLFMRLPQFAEDLQPFNMSKKLKMDHEGGIGRKRTKVKQELKPQPKISEKIGENNSTEEPTSPNMHLLDPNSNSLKAPALSSTPSTPAGNIVDMRGKFVETPSSSLVQNSEKENQESEEVPEKDPLLSQDNSLDNEADVEDEGEELNSQTVESVKGKKPKEEYVNSVGVRFTQQTSKANNILLPYGLPCIRELFRFLVSLCNPYDKQNTDAMIHIGLNLLTVAFEIGADSIGNYHTLMTIVKDEMCRNLFSLLSTERLSIFQADLQLCFLLFESLRSHLKFQLENYLNKLAEIIASDNPKIPYETRELALENILQLWRIPGFVAELYINYDCDLYCTNLFEDLTKLLSKTALSATQSIYSIHLLSMDALNAIMEVLERNCTAVNKGSTPVGSRHSRNNSTADRIVLDIETPGSGNESSAVETENISNYIGVSRLERYSKNINERQSVSHEQLMDLKEKKRILSQGTELFNNKAEKGIQYLQENGVLNPVLDPKEVAQFLRENSGLDKKQIGEFVSKKKNVESKILEHFVKSFDFTNLRIDMALRLYLETFRLPGEAPLISLVMEHFADHWHILNGEPFAHVDAAFGLAYAVIMLNMDQHNHNVKKMNIPMTVDEFVRNLRGMNGKADFDHDMLVNIYNAIKNEEIVMPAEQTGQIRESYLWKVLLRRGAGKDGQFHHVMGAVHDRELFQLIWGPTLAALSFMFDKSSDMSISQKCVNGFAMSASIASTYGLNSEFDALVLTLCKFSTLLNVSPELGDITINVAFGQNVKAQLATRTVFSLVQKYGDCMRESWRNIFEVLGQLFKLKLLPKSLIEVDDFCKPNGKFMLVAERVPIQKTDAGLFSSWYLYLSSDNQRQPSHEEQEVIKISRKCIRECKIDQIINESKFLQFDSLQELLRCLSANLKPPTTHKSLALERYEEDLVVFMLETMVRILIQNRDRLLPIWDNCKDPLYQLLYTDGKDYGYEYLLVRTTIAILKLSAFLMRNEELCPVVLQSLKLILKFKTPSILRLSRQISIGMYELLKTSAQNIHSEADWGIVFAILECVGAGAVQKHYEEERSQGAKSDGAVSSEEDSGLADRGYTSDSEILKSNSMSSTPLVSPLSNENWILVNNETEVSPNFIQENCLAYPCKLIEHSPFALVKCWDSLAFIVRNVAHITPYNFEGCVKCIRTFVEASINSGPKSQNRKHSINTELQRKKLMRKENKDRKRPVNNAEEHSSEGEAELESLSDRYPTIAIQLLDLMHTLHTRTAQIFRWWAEEGGAVPQCSALWAQGWCPLLQGIARLATDLRREVRTSAITCLQRALLVHDLQTLSGPEWAGCFKQVLFPLLTCLLNESINDPSLLEESRMRSATIMSKVFLHHLTPLITLPKFSDLWLDILDYLEKFMRVGSDMLYEAMLESLKNMLLVMHSVRIFHNPDGISHAPLWDLTWSKIGSFLPNLKDELFKEEVNVPKPVQVEAQPMPQVTFGPIPVGIKTENFFIPVNEVYEIPGPPQQQLGNEVMFSNNQSNGQEAEAVQQGQTFMENYPSYVNQSNVLCNPDPNYNSQMQNAYQQDNLKIESPVKNAIGVQNIPMIATSGSNQNSPLHSIEPPVPISHLLAGNQYPSLTKVPPPNIVQSFAPVFVQPTNVQSESEIYTDYVNDPYNLTLQNPANGNEQSQMAVPNQSVQDVEGHSKVGVSNIFQSSNYFGNDTVIPPGSEVFFNSP